jgi:hypothetical protein
VMFHSKNVIKMKTGGFLSSPAREWIGPFWERREWTGEVPERRRALSWLFLSFWSRKHEHTNKPSPFRMFDFCFRIIMTSAHLGELQNWLTASTFLISNFGYHFHYFDLAILLLSSRTFRVRLDAKLIWFTVF